MNGARLFEKAGIAIIVSLSIWILSNVSDMKSTLAGLNILLPTYAMRLDKLEQAVFSPQPWPPNPIMQGSKK